MRNSALVVVLVIFALVSLFPIAYMLAWSFGPAIEAASTSYSISLRSVNTYRLRKTCVALCSTPLPQARGNVHEAKKFCPLVRESSKSTFNKCCYY